MTARASAPAQLVTVAVIVGLLQIMAGVLLCLAKPEALAQAAGEGSMVYILAISGLTASWLVAWLLRARLGLSVGIGLLGSALSIGLSASSASALGLIYYGEFLAHHFLALLAAAICLLVGQRWLREPELGGLRAAPLLLASLGVLLLLGQHLASLPILGVELELLWQIGSVALLLAIPAALLLLWRELGWAERGLAIAAIGPLAVRVAIGGSGGLSGTAPGVAGAMPMVTALTIAGITAFVLLRPRVDAFARVVSLAVGAGVSYKLDALYQGPKFQFLEERIGGLVRSLLGFELPYPTFVVWWKAATAIVAIFTMTAAIVAALLDSRLRPRALGLALIVIAGFGLTSPQLLLMHAAGTLAFLASLREGHVIPVEPVLCPPPDEPELILAEVAERLEIEAPVIIEEASGTVIALRGEHLRNALDLRARSADGQRWTILLRFGMIGRGSADAEVLPGGDEGHRLRGDPRFVGGEESGVLAALSAFPTATARFWEAGCEVALGDELSRLSGASVEALVRALGRQLRS